MFFLIALTIGYVSRLAVLTLVLWIMIKLQKMNYNFLGLLGSAALASALEMIPYFGDYIAAAALGLCIWKVTGASIVPDVLFTVAVGYALMFAVQMMLITGLTPSLSSFRSHARDESGPPVSVAAAPATAPEPANQTDDSEPGKKAADEWLKGVTIKGTTENGVHSMILISVNQKNYTLVTDASTPVHTTNGTCRMRLVNVSEPWAIIEVNGENGYLRLH
jgi:hypothetical protein